MELLPPTTAEQRQTLSRAFEGWAGMFGVPTPNLDEELKNSTNYARYGNSIELAIFVTLRDKLKIMIPDSDYNLLARVGAKAIYEVQYASRRCKNVWGLIGLIAYSEAAGYTLTSPEAEIIGEIIRHGAVLGLLVEWAIGTSVKPI